MDHDLATPHVVHDLASTIDSLCLGVNVSGSASAARCDHVPAAFRVRYYMPFIAGHLDLPSGVVLHILKGIPDALRLGRSSRRIVDATGCLVMVPSGVLVTAEENAMRLRICLDELLPAKTAARELPQALRRLEEGSAEQLVITNRSEPRAVLITVERYEMLLSAASA
jgi:PHD/YefM family antitoxin component YafN of YafNO toxin-antitoxin module